MTTGKISIKDGKFGSVSQPNLKECRNKQLCLVIYGHKRSQIDFLPLQCCVSNYIKTKDSFLPCEASALFQQVYIAILLPENNNDFLNNFIFSHTCFQATGDTSKPLYTSYRRNQSIIRSCTCVLFLSRTVAMTFKN